MFYDLNLQRTLTNEGVIEFKRLLECCLEEDYETVAITRTFTDTLLTQKEVNDYKTIPVSSQSLQLSNSQSRTLRQLSRVTIEISQTKNMQQLNDFNAKVLETYDLIAIKPKTQKIFHSLCVQYDYYDIITFDMSEKIPFMLKRSPVFEAIRKGKYFEICLGPLYDINKKRVCLTNCMNIIKATKGKNLIVSSEVSSSLYHRSGYDICSLLVSLGLKKEEAYRCVTENPKKCVAGSRFRRSYKGSIEVMREEEVVGYRNKQLVKIEKFNEMMREREKARTGEREVEVEMEKEGDGEVKG